MKCPICGSEHLKFITQRKKFPVLQNAIFKTEKDSLSVPMGEIEFYVCLNCEFLFNAKYQQVVYDDSYENYQGYSEIFDKYTTENVNRVVKNVLNATEPVTIIEVGCGQGDFLKQVMQKIPSDMPVEAFGFDPAYNGDNKKNDRYKIFSKYFEGISDVLQCTRGGGYFVIIARHVIEHILNPDDFLKYFTQFGDNVILFIETPDYRWILKNVAFEDIIYEHCGFFSPKSLQHLLLKHRFVTIDFCNTFNGQYMWIEAKKENHLVKECEDYHVKEKKVIIGCESSIINSREKIYVWGAGAKGVAFLNLLDPKKIYVEKIIDVNPKKQKHFLPGTGHEIVAPEYLQNVESDLLIIVMNENYLNEIKTKVQQLGIGNAKFLTLKELYDCVKRI